ncbi:MAG: peptidoglycan-binding protein, partial [Halanaerobiales bacterium]
MKKITIIGLICLIILNIYNLILLEQTSLAYFNLKDMYQALDYYDAYYLQGGWPKISVNPALKKGDYDWRVTGLRQRLKITGELPATEPDDSLYFDQPLEQAIKEFQESHGLIEDGIAGEETIKEMNISVKERIKQIQNNLRIMEKYRQPGSNYIIVNIPDFKMKLIRN